MRDLSEKLPVGSEDYRRFWEESLNRLDKYLREIEAATTKSKTNGSGKKSSKSKSRE